MPIRLGCMFCDRSDSDGIDAVPTSWFSVEQVQDLDVSTQAMSSDRSDAAWQTHLGVCPECQDAELWLVVPSQSVE
ncbi:hypothetical protein I41_04930 [Lacipirellula limnantheis]|uniref:Uncharacterized protein n=1 Tax=Lacipirellula limnantheis TaxID=2528024 RepID=A0A517TSI0_9BACT|nr:hypothetical protein I41_04930 [Lacipirellula limnantheis]